MPGPLLDRLFCLKSPAFQQLIFAKLHALLTISGVVVVTKLPSFEKLYRTTTVVPNFWPQEYDCSDLSKQRVVTWPRSQISLDHWKSVV